MWAFHAANAVCHRKRTAPAAPRQLESLHRALDVLERLAQPRAETGLAALAEPLRHVQGGVYRILTTMSARGYVDKSLHGTYRLGVRAWELGCAVPELRLVTVARAVHGAADRRSTRRELDPWDAGRLRRGVPAPHRRLPSSGSACTRPIGGHPHPRARHLDGPRAARSRLDARSSRRCCRRRSSRSRRDTITDRDRLRARVRPHGPARLRPRTRPAPGAPRWPAWPPRSWTPTAPIAAVNVSLPRVRSTRRRLAELGRDHQRDRAGHLRALRFSGFTREQLPPDGRAALVLARA